MRALRQFLIVVAALALAAGIGGWILDHQTFRSRVIVAAIHDSGTCDQIAAVAPNLLAERLAVSSVAVPQLASVVTPAYVCGRLDSFLPQLEAYYRSDGPPPQLDLRDLQTQLGAAGIPIPAATKQALAQPIRYSNPSIDQPLQSLSRSSQRFTGLALLIALAGMILVWLVGGKHRWSGVAAIWIVAAVALAIEVGLIKLIPAIVTTPLSSSQYAALAPPIRALAERVTGQADHQLLLAAAACVAVGLAVWLLGFVLGWRGRRPRSAASMTLAEQDD